MNKIIFVRDLVFGILDKDWNSNYVTDIVVDDGGNCIHVTISGDIGMKVIAEIGNTFGDKDPTIYGVGNDKIKLVMLNYKIKELLDY